MSKIEAGNGEIFKLLNNSKAFSKIKQKPMRFSQNIIKKANAYRIDSMILISTSKMAISFLGLI